MAYDNWTWNAGTNTLTIISDTGEGDTEGTAYDFDDVQTYATANTLDMTTQCTSQHCIGFKIVIGDGSNATWFVDTNKHVVFKEGVINATWQYVVYIKNYSSLRFGEIVDADDRSTKNGVSIIFTINYGTTGVLFFDSRSLMDVHSCTFVNLGSSQPWTLYSPTEYSGKHKRAWNNLFIGRNLIRLDQPNEGDIFNFIMQSGQTGFTSSAFSYMDRIFLSDYGQVFSIGQAYDIVTTNLYARGLTVMGYIGGGWTGTADMINTDADVWNFTWVAGDTTGTINRKYELDVTVTDENGVAIEDATVILYDKDETEIFSETTSSAGTIDTQTITYGYYDKAHGNTLQEYSPHKLIVKKSGYQTEQDVFDMDDVKKLQISLQKATDIIFVDGEPALNLSEQDPESELFVKL